MNRIRIIVAVIFGVTMFGLPVPVNAVPPSAISGAQYPVGMDEDSAGNIYIAAEENSSDPTKRGLVVVPKLSGNLFGQAVTSGQEKLLFNPGDSIFVKGVAVDSSNDVFFSTSEGKLYALTATSRSVFGFSIPANTPTVLFSGTAFKGSLQFDSTGLLYGIDHSHNTVSVVSNSTATVFGQSVTANTPTVIWTYPGGWFWDLAVDANDNVLVANGFNYGVYLLPKNTGTAYGQPVTANTPIRLDVFQNPFSNIPPSGIDVGPSGNVFVSSWGDAVYVYAPTSFTSFGQNFAAGSITKILRTKYGRTNQGLTALADGSLVTGGADATYLVKTDSTEPDVEALNAANGDTVFTASYVNEPGQSYSSWGTLNSDTSQVTKFTQPGVSNTEGGGFDGVTNKTWLMKDNCTFYSLDTSDQTAPEMEFTLTTGYGTKCWGFASRNDGTALVSTNAADGDNKSKVLVVNLQTGNPVSTDPLNGLFIQTECLAIAVNSHGDIWVSSNSSWNLHKVDAANGSLGASVPFYDRTMAGITSMDFDSNDRLIGTYFGISEGVTSIDMSINDPMSTAVLNETTDRFGWTSRALWVYSGPLPHQNQSSNLTSPSTNFATQTISLSKFRFDRGSSKLTKSGRAALKSQKSEFASASKIIIRANAGRFAAIPDKNVRALAHSRAKSIKRYLIHLGIRADKIEMKIRVVNFGSTPKSHLVYTP